MTPSQQTAKAVELAKVPTYDAVKAAVREYADNQVKPVNAKVAELLDLHAPALAVWLSDRLILAPLRSPAEEPAQAVPVAEIGALLKEVDQYASTPVLSADDGGVWKMRALCLALNLRPFLDRAAGPATTPTGAAETVTREELAAIVKPFLSAWARKDAEFACADTILARISQPDRKFMGTDTPASVGPAIVSSPPGSPLATEGNT